MGAHGQSARLVRETWNSVHYFIKANSHLGLHRPMNTLYLIPVCPVKLGLPFFLVTENFGFPFILTTRYDLGKKIKNIFNLFKEL